MNADRVGSDRPFVDRPVTDPVAAARAARIAAAEWGLRDPLPWRSGMNAIYLSGEVVLRVGHVSAPAGTSAQLAEKLTVHGVRVPRPRAWEPVSSGDLAVTAWHRIVPSGAPVDWEEVGAMVRRVHGLAPGLLPTAYPLADPRAFPWWDFATVLADVGASIDVPARAGLAEAIERNAFWVDFSPGTSVVCHGDVHPGNVIMTERGAVLLDWDLLSLAPPGWDHGPLMTWRERWGGEEFYAPFASGYGWSGRGDEFTEAVAELRLVAATLMRVRAARTDPGARPEADRRLRYWRGEPMPPAWTAQ